MSLVKRLWIVVGLIMLAAMVTAAGINMLSAKRYLENEIKVKNLDTATALAMSISQSAKDITTVELLVSSQFDLGHYRRIDYMGVDGALVVRREREAPDTPVPSWFMRLVPIEPEPGFAVIQSGWRQLGSIKLQSDASFAYDSIWKSTLTLLELFVVGGIFAGVLGTLFIRSVIRPLNRVVDQAEALAQRRFIQIKPPDTLEFRLIVQAMNRLSEKIKNILDNESSRLEKLKTDYELDKLTGYMVRSVFLHSVESEIEREDAEKEGTLVLVHLENLERLNQEVGRAQTDSLIQSVTEKLKQAMQEEFGARFGRLSAADIGVLFPGHTNRQKLLQAVHATILSAEETHVLRIDIGATGYGPHSTVPILLMECDQNLRRAASEGWLTQSAGVGAAPRMERAWGDIFEVALRNHEFRLAIFPVRGPNNAYLHSAALARLHPAQTGETLVAGSFLPWARKQGLAGRIDLETVSNALTQLKNNGHDICITLGFQSVCDEHQVKLLVQYLVNNAEQARRLYLSVPEDIVFGYFSEFTRFCELVIPCGCWVGVQHLDRYVGQLGRVHHLGLHYIKVSQSLIKEVSHDSASPIMLRGLCTIAHTMGFQVFADGVIHAADATLLFELGFDGVAGPGIT